MTNSDFEREICRKLELPFNSIHNGFDPENGYLRPGVAAKLRMDHGLDDGPIGITLARKGLLTYSEGSYIDGAWDGKY